MLAKLLKYEFKATGRTLLPVYVLLIAVSLLVKITVTGGHYDFMLGDSLMGMLQAVIMLAYGCIIGTVCIVTVLLLIQRFYKNLLRDEGYLMNTLPVPPWQNIMAKLIPAVIWSLISLCMAALSVMIIGMEFTDWLSFFGELGEFIRRVITEFGPHGILFMLELLLLILVAMAKNVLNVYVAIAAGHTANNHRILWSVAAYIVICMAVSFADMLALNLLGQTNLVQYFFELFVGHYAAAVHFAAWALIASSMLLNAVFFWGTNYILKNRLNLE